MIKGKGKTQDGRSVVLLGILPENVEKLVQGNPMLIDGKEFGFPDMVICVTYGETEEDIMKAFGFDPLTTGFTKQ